MVDWYLDGVKFGNCSCDYSCPCQFELLPSHGYCHGIEVIRIDHGRFGDVDLSGLQAVTQYQWPGAIFEGNGEMQVVIDKRATPAQREALTAILHGQETREAATHWWVFHAMSKTVHETLFEEIEFTVDVESRSASVSVPGLLTASGRPILSKVDGSAHRVQIRLPHGVEFETADVGSASTRATMALSLELTDSFGQFNHFRITGDGFVHGQS
jgi:hypothetical protein